MISTYPLDHAFHLLAILFYGMCYLMVAPFGDGYGLLGSAFIVWLVLLIPASWMAAAIWSVFTTLHRYLFQPRH